MPLPLSRSERGLDALLRDLGASVALGGPARPEVARLATGLAAVDRALGGGFPRGGVSEVVGARSCGRTSLALALLARVTAAGELAVVVDASDGFDAGSAAAAGVALERVLWVRPPGLTEALRSVEHVLHAGGFPLVLLDLTFTSAAPLRLPSAAWPRLRKATAAAAAAFVLLARERVAGTFADLALELAAAAPRFESGPDWLAGLDGRARLVRSRSGPADADVAVRWCSDGRHAA